MAFFLEVHQSVQPVDQWHGAAAGRLVAESLAIALHPAFQPELRTRAFVGFFGTICVFKRFFLLLSIATFRDENIPCRNKVTIG